MEILKYLNEFHKEFIAILKGQADPFYLNSLVFSIIYCSGYLKTYTVFPRTSRVCPSNNSQCFPSCRLRPCFSSDTVPGPKMNYEEPHKKGTPSKDTKGDFKVGRQGRTSSNDLVPVKAIKVKILVVVIWMKRPVVVLWMLKQYRATALRIPSQSFRE